MRSRPQIESGKPSRIDLLAMLSNAFKRDQAKVGQVDLLDRFREMENAGYIIGTPSQAPRQNIPTHTCWQVPITMPTVACTLIFYVRNDV